MVYDAGQHLVIVRLPGAPEFAITPATLRRNDTSATSVNEWTGGSRLHTISQQLMMEEVNKWAG